MSKLEEQLQELSEHLSGFFVHEGLIPEIMSIIRKSGQGKNFFKIFYRRLDFLKSHGKTAQEYHEEFERINAEIYSMHIASKFFNVRILYSFLDDGTILLRAFEEAGGKRSTDYTHQIPLAEDRLQIIKEDRNEYE